MNAKAGHRNPAHLIENLAKPCHLMIPKFDTKAITRQTFVRFVEYHAVLESTNTLAAELADELQKRSPALVLADEQTAGRGRANNSWWSTAGSLTFSLVLDADNQGPSQEFHPRVALAAGLSVRRVVAERVTGNAVLIKWPNDVLVDDRKVCGILCEHHSTPSGAVFIVGIGINANSSLSAAPDDVRLRATSLYDLTGDSVDLTGLLTDVLVALEHDFTRLQQDPDVIIREVAAHDRLRDSQVVIQTPAETLRGLCGGIATDGSLLILTESGPRSVRAGTVLSFD